MVGRDASVRVIRELAKTGAILASLASAPVVVLADLVGVDPVAEEAAEAIVGNPDELTELVTNAIGAGNSGASKFFRQRSPERLSLEEVDNLTVQRNLDVKVARLRVRQSEQSVIGSDAVFDTNLNYSMSTNSSRSYERSETFIREHEIDVDFDAIERNANIVASGGTPEPDFDPCVVVDGILTNPTCAVSEVSPIVDFASFDSSWCSSGLMPSSTPI